MSRDARMPPPNIKMENKPKLAAKKSKTKTAITWKTAVYGIVALALMAATVAGNE